MNRVALLLISLCHSITLLNEAAFPSLRSQEKASLVLLYEEWCGFSQRAWSALVRLEREPEFAALGVPIFAFDTYGKDAFKAGHGVKSVPIISLYVRGAEIVFGGLIDAHEVLKFVKSKSSVSKPVALLSHAELVAARAEKGALFLYFGKAEGPRYQLFAEGAFEFPHQSFYSSDCPYLQESLGLMRGEFYFFDASGAPLRYKRAFQRPRYIPWIQLALAPKTQVASRQLYDRFLSAKNPLLVLFAPEGAAGDAAMQLFRESFEAYYDRFTGVGCAEGEADCQGFLARVPFDARARAASIGAFVFVCTFSPKAAPPLFYLHKSSFGAESTRAFIADYLKGAITFDIFSEERREQSGRVWRVTRNSFADFFGQAGQRDVVLLFHASKDCVQCPAALGAFTALAEELLATDAIERALWAGHFDAARNSHEVLDLPRSLPLARLYKQASPYAFHDLALEGAEPGRVRDALLRFLTDAASLRLPLPPFAEEM